MPERPECSGRLLHLLLIQELQDRTTALGEVRVVGQLQAVAGVVQFFFGQQAATLLAPSRMARLMDMAVQPVIVTLPPFFSVVFTAPISASSERDAAALEMSACLAMCSISSLLFTSRFPS